MCDAETAYALALVFDLLPTAEQRQHAGDRLAELVRDSGYHIRTGFVGTPLICDALCSTGHHLAAYRLLTAARMPLLALPGDDGRDHHLGTLGLHAPGWLDQPRRDDFLQPLRPRRSGRLDAPHDRRSGSGRAGLPPHGDSPSPRRRADALPHQPSHPLRVGGMRLEDRGRKDSTWMWSFLPNTTALVTLPGSDMPPIEVGSGSWHWSVPYQDPDARGPYTVDDLVGEIMGNASARDAMVEVLVQLDSSGFEQMVLFSERNSPLRDGLQKLLNYEQAVTRMNEALAGL